MSVRFSVKMDEIFVKKPRHFYRKRLEIRRLRSMSSTESVSSDGNNGTTTDHHHNNKKKTKQQKKKKLRSKVVPSCESALVDSKENHDSNKKSSETDQPKKDESTVGICDGVDEEDELHHQIRLQCASHGSVSICGRRREMEDAVTVIPGFLSEIDFFGVYDGHGGSRVAQECSEKLHRLLAKEMNESGRGGRSDGGDAFDDWEKILVSCFLKMDEEVSGKGQEVEDMKSIGSTAVVALIGKEKIIVANCGDSRAVMSRGGVAVPLSRDHKPDRSDEMERIEAAGGRVINWNGYRVLGVLATSRSIGDHYLKPYVISVPEVLVTERTESDEFLILASDGLWDVLSNEQVCDVARRCFDGRIMRKKSKSNAVRKISKQSNIAGSRFGLGDGAAGAAVVLTELAMARGSKDNISVVVIELNKMNRSRILALP